MVGAGDDLVDTGDERLRRRHVSSNSIRRTEDKSYSSGWRYTLHYGTLTPGPQTLEDGTIRRYDNAHEDTKDHELHVAPDLEPKYVEFSGIVELFEQFSDEIPKPRFGPSKDNR